jgi:hypothetical protein
MGIWAAAAARVRGWVGSAAITAAAAGVPGFQRWSIGGPIDALVQGVWGNSWLEGGPVSRDDALLIAAVERGRDEICAAVATLPLQNFRGLDLLPSPFLDQPDPDVPNVVMFAQLVEDLIFDGISWWRKTSYDYRGFPLTARRVTNVSLTPPSGDAYRTPAPLPSGVDPRGASVWVDGVEVSAFEMIRFDSPLRPLLVAGARAIRKALLIDALASMYADNPRPMESFTDSDDRTVAQMTPGEIEAFLARYKSGRKRGGPAWIPKAATRLDNSTPSPAELQLIQLQQQSALELALKMGLDPEDVGVNTTSRTYFNGVDRGQDKINRTFGPYLHAISDRLSMGDITPRGQATRHDVSQYLKPDPVTQATYWNMLKGMGVVDASWIGQQAGIAADVVRRAGSAVGGPPVPPALPPSAGQNVRVLPAQLGPALTAQRLMAGAFSADQPGGMMRFSVRDFATAAPPATVDTSKRTITGLAVPYNAVASKYGVGFRFRPGSLEYDSGNLNRLRAMDGHTTYVGTTQNVEDTKAGPMVTLKILDGPEGSPTKMQRDQLLMDAAGGLADGLSVGVDFSLDPTVGDVVWSEGEQVFDVIRATWNETSVTPDPAFTGARVTKVAATRGGTMQCQHCGQPHPAGMSCVVAAQLYPQQMAAAAAAPQQFVVGGVTYSAPPAGWAGQPVQPYGQMPVQPQAPQPVQPPAQFAAAAAEAQSSEALSAALNKAVGDIVAAGQTAPRPPVDTTGQFAQPVNPGALPIPGQAAPAQWGAAKVTEPEPYRIGFTRDGSAILARGSHDFSADMIAALKDGDKASADRALSFVQRKMAAQFNVAVADVDETNPTRQRPEMWVDQRTYRYPIWSAINKGSLTDITPFTFPKFSSASGLVGAHTPGTEPTTGTYVTTGQTITPTGYSGKARINREVWDQGGNPQTSTLIWNQMVRGVNEALEAAAVTELNAGSFTALNTFTAGAVDRAAAGKTLGMEIEHGLALLQFARGGYAFTDAFGQADLYLTLTDAADTAGSKLYPMLNPTNRNGTTERLFSVINVGGQDFAPAWALAAAGQTAAAKSYLIDRQSVHGWASPPLKLTLDQIAVAYVDLGVWGYQATAVSDTTGVRTLTWDPVA